MSLDDSSAVHLISSSAKVDIVSKKYSFTSRAIWFLPWLVGKLFNFVFVLIPSGLISVLTGVLGARISITLKFSSLLLLILVLVAVTWGIIRYRYLTKYSRLPPEQERQEPKLDLFVGSRKDDERKSGLSNYLDDFLSAIKIFGYLDKKVFHELTKQLRTIKLEKGELVRLNDIKGFSIVIDGTVSVFAKTTTQNDLYAAQSKRTRQFGEHHYQLLNEVKKGAPLSSLFSILSLFTQDIELNENLRRHSSPFGMDNLDDQSSDRQPSTPDEAEFPDLSLDEVNEISIALDGHTSPTPTSPRQRARRSAGSMASANTRNQFYQSNETASRSHSIHSNKRGAKLQYGPRNKPRQRKHSRSHPSDLDVIAEDIVCVASENSTIAILPAEAFSILTKKYPKAASHIVQVILARCQRVTFETCHGYLGLTPQIFQAEETLNSKAKYELPAYIHDGAIRKLREQALKDNSKKVFLRPPNKRTLSKVPNNSNKERRSRQVVLEPDESHPGDLLSTVPLSRIESGNRFTQSPLSPTTNYGNVTTLRFTGEDETEDSILRTALVECMFKVLGFDGALIQKNLTSTDIPPSVEASPLFLPVDSSKAHLRMRSGSSNLSAPFLGSFARLEMESALSEGDASSIDEAASSHGFRSNGTRPLSYEHAQQEASQYMEVIYCKSGSVLFKQGDRCPGLYYVVDGVLEVGYTDDSKEYHLLHEVMPGGLAGFISSIAGHKSFVQVRAKSDVYVGFLPRPALEKITEKYPMMYITFAKTLTSVLSKLVLDLDFGLEWIQVDAGQTLLEQGDDADAMYLVLSGRLRGITEDTNGRSTKIEEYGNGDSIGELEVLTRSKYSCTLHAIRDSELARFPRALFEGLAMRYPPLTFEINRIVASRVRKSMSFNQELSLSHGQGQGSYKTFAVVPIVAGLPVNQFSEKLVTAFQETNNSSVLVNNSTALTYLGRHAFNRLGHLKLSRYLTELEDRYQTIVYVADTGVKSPWTQKCITQADCILLLADANASTDVGEYEHLLVKTKTTARSDLVLLHPDRNVSPGSTSVWLKNRIWVYCHHHVQFNVLHTDDSTSNGVPNVSGRKLVQKIRSRVWNLQIGLMTKYRARSKEMYAHSAVHKNDFNRLARILSGQAVGLVLGGGGARGISHIGVIKALEETGVPIDFIGGTSIGAFIGGLYAKEYDIVPIYGRAKKFAQRISSLWRMALDLTYPTTSYTTGHEFNRGIWKTFGDSRIEDFWLRFYTNTTNITHSRKEIHTSGYSWRYIRASMSLAGLLPPLTDKGSMLLDGGYVDNLTVSQMQSWGAKYIFAVDVGSIDDTAPMEYGDTLSGLWVLFNRWNFFSRHANVPNMAEIQQRLAYVSSVGELERAKTAPGVIYMRPPIDDYATLDFGKFEEILDTGSRYAHSYLSRLRELGDFPKIPGAENHKSRKRRALIRRNSI